MQLYVGQRIVIFAGRLQRCMGCPMGKVKKKRPLFIRFDHPNRFICVVIGQVFRRFEIRPTVEAGGESQRCPQKAIDRIKILSRLNNLFIVTSSV